MKKIIFILLLLSPLKLYAETPLQKLRTQINKTNSCIQQILDLKTAYDTGIRMGKYTFQLSPASKTSVLQTYNSIKTELKNTILELEKTVNELP